MNLSKFHSRGKIYKILSKRFFLYIFWIIFSPIISAYALIKMYGFSLNEWLILILIIPLFKLVFNFVKKHVKREIKEEYVNIYTLKYAVIITSVLMAIIFPILIYLLGKYDISAIKTFNDAVKIQLENYIGLKTSPVAYAIASKVAFLNGIVIYFLSFLSGKWLFFSIIVTAGEGFIFFAILSVFALYLLRKKELSKIYLPLHHENIKKKKAIIPIFSIISIILIFLLSFFILKYNLIYNKKLVQTLNLPQKIAVDIVDGEYITAGTILKLEKLKNDMGNTIGKTINKKIDMAFDLMILNVDGYLDWYYGLTAEYIRALKFITGGLENFMKNKLKEHLHGSGSNTLISNTMKEVPSLINKSKQKFDKLAKEIIKTNTIKIKPFDSIIVKKKASIKKMMKIFSKIEDKIPFGARAGISIGVGVITGIIVKRIISKSTYKLSFKILTRLIGKKIFSRWAGTSAGATVGAGVGSSVPGAGTLIGGLIGAGVGFIASLFIDYSVLKLEEKISRESYRRDIISAINESRREFKQWRF